MFQDFPWAQSPEAPDTSPPGSSLSVTYNPGAGSLASPGVPSMGPSGSHEMMQAGSGSPGLFTQAPTPYGLQGQQGGVPQGGVPQIGAPQGGVPEAAGDGAPQQAASEAPKPRSSRRGGVHRLMARDWHE